MAMQIANNQEAQLLAHINPTPLIDVLLVLLIVFILALPSSTQRTNVDLPTQGDPTKRPSITVEVDFDGSLYVDGAPIADLAMLEKRFRSIAQKSVQPNVLLDANSRARYDTVAKVLAMAQRSGVQRLGFAGQERFKE